MSSQNDLDAKIEYNDQKLNGFTPVMQQYFAIKKGYPECLVFFRMGDFYELFDNDAVKASEELNLVLTHRGRYVDGKDILMCGVPHHASNVYLQRLIKKGYSVAICEQLETPEDAKKRGGYKAIIRREVVRIITPGVVLEEELVIPKENNYLACCHFNSNKVAIAWVEVSTGEFAVTSTEASAVMLELSRINPRELLISDSKFQDETVKRWLIPYPGCITRRPEALFREKRCIDKVKQYTKIVPIAQFYNLNNIEVVSVGTLIEYLEHTQKQNMPYFNTIRKIEHGEFLLMDYNTRRNLELLSNIDGKQNNSLLSVIDKTVTGLGARLLKNRIMSPLKDPRVINKRLDNVEFFIKNLDLKNIIRDNIKNFPDLERILARIHAKRARNTDILYLYQSLKQANKLFVILHNKNFTPCIASWIEQLVSFDSLLQDLGNALRDDVCAEELTEVSGNINQFIRPGYNHQLDGLYNIQNNSKKRLDELRDNYKKFTGISNMKLTNNNVIGYFIEVPSGSASKMHNTQFIHRQSLSNSVRYTTTELKDIESALLSCNEKIINLENEIFEDLCNLILRKADRISVLCHAISNLDITICLAEIAALYSYTRPIVDDSLKFIVEDGRHPIVERYQKESFISNSCIMEKECDFWLLTGPNMAGKSTFLRQNALICIMAQLGSFVPAAFAHIGTVDKLFTRIGAEDNIARGYSTFMVEMVETAYILHGATQRSLIILDEIGRGTSTYDGMSIAWAIIEYLHNVVNARTFFTTHYHELAELRDQLERLSCYSMQIRKCDEKIIFMYKLTDEIINESYGIEVADLAGLPKSIVERAKFVMNHNMIKNKRKRAN